MKKLSKKKKNNLPLFLFLIISFIITSLTVGYSTSSKTFAINGAALVRSSADVRITNVQRVQASSDVTLKTLTLDANGTFSLDCKLTTIWSKVYFEVTVTNLSSSPVLVTSIKELSELNSHMEYTTGDFEINKTKIPPASETKITLCFQYKGDFMDKYVAGSFEIMQQWANPETSHLKTSMQFTFYKVPQYTYTVNATPEDSLVALEVDGKTIASGTGSVSELIDENTNITWKVTRNGYYPQSGTEVVLDNTTKDITLSRTEEKKFTIVPTPSDSLVTIKKGTEVLVSNIGKQTVMVDDLSALTYTVSKLEYKDASGSYTLNGEDYTVNVTLEELPWITGTFVNTNRKEATTKEDTNYHPGYYLIELWGGKGGEYLRASSKNAGHRGAAGYIYGVANLEYNSKIYFTLGGNSRDGESGGASRGGANGGGGGGGSSLVAGKPGDGGDGGTLSSETTILDIGTVFHGKDGTLNGAKAGRNGLGGTAVSRPQQNEGGIGKPLAGGDGNGNGGGGGGGYYGGGGSGGAGTLSSNQPGGAGGGSSFIATNVTFSGLSSNVTSKLTNNNTSSSGGSIVITYLGKTLS